MSEDRNRGFFSRMFTPYGDETTVFHADDLGEDPEDTIGASRGFSVERAVGIIDGLPSDVPRASALRIVRQTLEAAGISIDDLGSSARAREAKLDSEIELSRERMQEMHERADEVVRDLEDQVRKAREARDFGISQEERKISAAREGLADVAKVREFFGLSGGDEPQAEEPEPQSAPPAEPDPASDDTQVMPRVDVDDTRVLRPRGPLSRNWEDEDTEPGDR